MTKQDFINELSEKLYEELPTAEVLGHLRYYQGYIDGEVMKGRDVEEVLLELGSPILIARSIMESPTGGRDAVTDPDASYYEGMYEASNSSSSAKESEVEECAGEEADVETEEAFSEEETIESDSSDENTEAQDSEYENVSGDTAYAKRTFLHDEYGHIEWGFIAGIVAVILVVLVGIWLVTKIVILLGPVLICVAALVLIMRAIRPKGE